MDLDSYRGESGMGKALKYMKLSIVDYREIPHIWEDVEDWNHFCRDLAAITRILDVP